MENELLEETGYVGDIPEGWKWVKLGEIGIVITGKTPSSKHPEDWGYDMPFVTPTDFKNYRKFAYDSERYLSSAGINKLKNKVLPENSVLVTCIGYIGKVVMNKIPVITNQQINSIIPNRNIVFPDFLYYVLVCNYETFKSFESNGTAVPILNKTDFENIEVLIPPFPEQKAIADVLSSIDDKIELLHRQNKTLEEMAMTLFRQWFIEPTKDGLPDGWEEVSLGDVFDYLEGPGIRNWQYSTRGIPFLNIRLIENGEINIKNANFISEEEAFGKYKKFLLQEGDVVISTSGTLGKYAIVRKYHLPLLLNTSIIRFRPKNKNYRIFMYLYLKSREFKEYLESSADGSVQANFGPTHLRKIKIIIPPNHTLEKFENAISPFYEKLNNNYSQIQTLEKLRDTLLPKLMSGEVRVKF
jgi:Restriction endonuclease S subunits